MTEIDYSLDGRVRSFTLEDELLYDETAGVSKDGWRDELKKLIKAQRWDVDRGEGLHAFVYPLIET